MKELERTGMEDEIDLLDLLKIIIRNKKIILVIWLLSFFVGGLLGYIKSTKNQITKERNFRVRNVSYSLGQSMYGIDINVEKFFDNKEFIESLFLEKEIKEIFEGLKNAKKEDVAKMLFDLKRTGNVYSVELKGNNDKEVDLLDEIFFRNLQKFIKGFYGNVLSQDLKVYENQIIKNKDRLSEIEERIKELIKENPNKNLGEVKELNPAIFSEKDAVSQVYSENYKSKEIIDNAIHQLNNSVIFESSLNNKLDKFSLKLMLVIFNVLGIFLGVFVVFIKEFLKSINWKELKGL